MGKTKSFFKKIRDTAETFHVKRRKIKEINGKGLKKAEEIKKRCMNTLKNCIKKVFMTRITTMVLSLTSSQNPGV